MITEKRILRGYKVKDSYYKKAMKRAQKEKGTLANLIENVVICFADGLQIKASKKDAFEQGIDDALRLIDATKKS